MLKLIEAYKGNKEYFRHSFTAYSLQIILQQRIKGFNVVGLTTDKFNGLEIRGRQDFIQVN